MSPAKPKKTEIVAVHSVKLTHPDKELFPEIHLTKKQLAEYYEEVAETMLPWIRDRPLSLLCCPQGRKSCFFQKHPAFRGSEFPPLIWIKEKNGERKSYAYVTEAAHLIELVQFNVLEIHPWGSQIDNLNNPDLLIFDLDPGLGVSDARIIEAAYLVKSMLEEFKLNAFPRVTGGKGIHVITALEPVQDWEEAKKFAKMIAETLAKESPDQFVSKAAIEIRDNKIFVDYLRNARGATAVASYSTRAREGAPVAVPLAWSELKRGKKIPTFHLKDVTQRIYRDRADIWNEMIEGAGRIKKRKPQ